MTLNFSKRLEDIPKSGIREFFDLVSESDGIISLGVGEPDFPAPWTVREEAIYLLERGETSYTSNQGIFELRKAIAQFHIKKYHVSYNPNNEILITNGVSEAADIVLRALLNDGDEVILPKPMYVCYEPLIKLAGGKVIDVDTSSSGFVPDPDLIEKAVSKKTKAIVLCYPNNPTGMTIPENILKKIAQIAEKHDLWVISDEIYGELVYGSKFVSFSSLNGMKARTIVLNGFSKTYAMTGWRVGYICGPESLVSRACKIHQYSALCASSIAQSAALEALRNAAKDVKVMLRSYERRRNMFVTGMNEAGLTTLLPDGAFYCFPSIEGLDMNAKKFASLLLKEEKVAVVPGTAFGVQGEGFIRCCFATDTDDLKEALKRIKQFVARHRK